MKITSIGFAVAALLLLTSGPATAQESFAALQGELRPGDNVYLTDRSGAELHGNVAAVGPSSLKLTLDGIEREWAETDVREVRKRGDSVKNGAIIGLIAGGVMGGIGGSLVSTLFVNEGASGTAPFLTVLALGMAGGAGIGAAIDGLIPGRTVVYRQPRGLTITPVVAPGTRAVQVGFSFP